ncbi:sigma-70 family RNA polymerase sigma factor [Candidatus Pacearchaeota archaeon]|nr:sigma-70 family RNA polymerase sigma factor [Candidatus Pacearchaeota archaeon]
MELKKFESIKRNSLLSRIYNYIPNKEDREDVIQDSLIKVFRNLEKYDERRGKSFYGWVQGIVKNTAIDHTRKEKSNPLKNKLISESDSPLDYLEQQTFISQDNSFDIKLVQNFLYNSIEKLPKSQKEIIKLRLLKNKVSYKQASQELNISEANLRSSYLRGRKNLGKMISKEFAKDFPISNLYK